MISDDQRGEDEERREVFIAPLPLHSATPLPHFPSRLKTLQMLDFLLANVTFQLEIGREPAIALLLRRPLLLLHQANSVAASSTQSLAVSHIDGVQICADLEVFGATASGHAKPIGNGLRFAVVGRFLQIDERVIGHVVPKDACNVFGLPQKDTVLVDASHPLHDDLERRQLMLADNLQTFTVRIAQILEAFALLVHRAFEEFDDHPIIVLPNTETHSHRQFSGFLAIEVLGLLQSGQFDATIGGAVILRHRIDEGGGN